MMENQALVSHLLLPVVPCFSCYWLLLLPPPPPLLLMAGSDEIVEATRGREIVSL